MACKLFSEYKLIIILGISFGIEYLQQQDIGMFSAIIEDFVL